MCAAGCVKPEQSIVDEFFTRSKLLDKVALQRVSTVVFDPAVNGIVESFDISKVSPEENGAKTVTVSAQVKVPGGGSLVQKTILLTLSKTRQGSPQTPEHWIVTGFIEREGTPATPRP
jgi:hypothetical protein